MQTYKFAFLVVTSLLLVACGGGGSQQATQTGQFIDDPVAGLTYSCTNGTQTNSGTTGSQGEFTYISGQTCTFSVGKVTLGTLKNIPTDGKVTPQDVAGVARNATAAPSAVAIAQFLQTLNDGSTSGKIVIPSATTTAFNASAVSAVTLAAPTGAIAQSDLSNLVTAVLPAKTLVTATAASANLDTQLTQNNISTTSGAVSANAPVVLNSIAVSLVDPSKNNQAAGLTELVKAVGYYSDGTNKDITSSVTWSSSDTSTLTVANAVATGKKAGAATVTASLTPSGASVAISGSTVITTNAPTVVSIAVSNSNSLPAGLTDQLTVTATMTDGSTKALSSGVTWASSDSSKATVSASGLVTGVAKGTSTITASYGSGTPLTATYSESVLDPNVLSLAISYVQSGLTSIQKTASAVLSAIAQFTDGVARTVTAAANWMVTPSNIASVVTDAVKNLATLTGNVVGSATIKATYTDANNNVVTSNTLNLTVTPLVSISGQAASGVAMSGATITATCQGSTVNFSATADASGNYVLNLPAGVTSPCLLSASVTDSTGKSTTFFSAVSADVGTSTPTANITPLSHLIVASSLGQEPSVSTSLSSVAGSLTNNKISSATSIVQTSLSTALGIPSANIVNPLTTSFQTATNDSGAPPSVQDAALDQLMSGLNVASVSISSLASTLSSATTPTAAAASLATLATNSGIPTSASSTCPFAVSGLFATVNVGATNFRNGDTSTVPSFGFLKLDFSTNTATNGSGASFTITQPNSSNPCQFRVSDSVTNKYVNFQVSRSGFIVATTFDPPDSTATAAKTMTAGTGSDCFKLNSYCSGFQLGFPVQKGLTMADLAGTWQSVEWNLDKYATGPSSCPQSGCGTVSNTPCPAVLNYDGTCTNYVSFARQFVVANTGAMSVYSCEGLGKGGSTLCANNLLQSLTLKMCSTSNDCPTVSIPGPNGSTTVSLTSTVDVFSGGQLVGRTLAFRAPNNDLIGFFVAGQGGIPNNDVAHANMGGQEFQEQFGVIFRPANAVADKPATGTVVRQPQFVVADWGTSIAGVTAVNGNSFTATLNAGTNAMSSGQNVYGGDSGGNYFISGTVVNTATCSSATSCQVTLLCPTTQNASNTECRTANGIAKLSATSGFGAFGFQIKENTQVYTDTLSSDLRSLTRTFSDTIDNGQVDVVQFDTPYPGMTYRAYVPATGSAPSLNESISIRGSGFSIAIGTATVSQQNGNRVNPGVGPAALLLTGCTMPGQVITYSSSNNKYGCDSTNRSTGKFFTVNLKY